MKVIATEFLTLDGVYQGPGGPDEDRRNGFDRGGWQAPIDDDEIGPFITDVYAGMDGMLLGRTTFDIWNSYWPHHDAGDPVSHGINVLPKYVPSTTLKNPTWQNTHVLDGDVEAKVRELRPNLAAICSSKAAAFSCAGSWSATSWTSSISSSTRSSWAMACGSSRNRGRRIAWSCSTRR